MLLKLHLQHLQLLLKEVYQTELPFQEQEAFLEDLLTFSQIIEYKDRP